MTLCLLALQPLLLGGCAGKEVTAPQKQSVPGPPHLVGEGSQASWSPDGEWIAGSYDGFVVVRSAIGDSMRILTVTPTDPSNDWQDDSPDWSPDGNWIVFRAKGRLLSQLSDSHDLWKYPAAGGQPIQLTATRFQREDTPTWSPDGQWIAFVGYEDAKLYRMPANGGPVEAVDDTLWAIGKPAWSADSKQIALASGIRGTPERQSVPRLVIVTLATRSVRILAEDLFLDSNGRKLLFGDCTWSPDGTSIAVTVAGSLIEVFDVNTGQHRPNALLFDIPGSPSYFYEPDWSPDGKSIAYTNRVTSAIQNIYVIPAGGIP